VTAAEKVERKEGSTMPAGSFDPSAARTATAPSGRIATPAALMARKSAIELVATPGWRLSVFSSLIALRPNGVAALPSPSMFAARLRIIEPIAGWSSGTSGNSRRMSGRSARAMERMSPPSRTMAIIPSQSAICPTSPRARSTEALAAVSEASVTRGMVPRKAAVRTEPAMRTRKMPLSTGVQDPISGPGRPGSCQPGAGNAASRPPGVVER
jgi:hypothetical protein